MSYMHTYDYYDYSFMQFEMPLLPFHVLRTYSISRRPPATPSHQSFPLSDEPPKPTWERPSYISPSTLLPLRYLFYRKQPPSKNGDSPASRHHGAGRPPGQLGPHRQQQPILKHRLDIYFLEVCRDKKQEAGCSQLKTDSPLCFYGYCRCPALQ